MVILISGNPNCLRRLRDNRDQILSWVEKPPVVCQMLFVKRSILVLLVGCVFDANHENWKEVGPSTYGTLQNSQTSCRLSSASRTVIIIIQPIN